MKPRLELLFILMLFSSLLWGQKGSSVEYCKETLNDVRDEFERGRPHIVYQILVDSTGEIKNECKICLNKNIEGFSVISQYELYEKFILSIIYMGFEDVSPYMKDFLGKHPLYIPEYKESTLRNLYKQFNTDPVFILGGSLSLGSSPVIPIERYSLANGNQEKKGLYSAPFSNTRIALKLSIPLNNSFELGFDPAYFSLGYKYNENLVHSNNILSDTPNSAGSSLTSILSFEERQNWVGVPLSLRYHFGAKKRKTEYTNDEWDKKKKQKFRFNLFTGIEADFLIDASFKNMVRTLADNPNQSVQDESINLLFDSGEDSPQLRNRNNMSLFFGAGVSRNIKKWRIGMDFRMGWMIANQVKIANRYANNDLLYLYGHVDNDFSLSDFSISLSFQRSVFNPKKIGRKARARGIDPTKEKDKPIANTDNGDKSPKVSKEKKDPAETKKEIAKEVGKISENEKLMEEIEKKMNELKNLKTKAEKLERQLKGMDEGLDRDGLEALLKMLKRNIEDLEERIKNKNND
ncbi:MAG: hypothetical protein ACI94Y_001628 [Maribacter sp.]|jgi:hypothetical protein